MVFGAGSSRWIISSGEGLSAPPVPQFPQGFGAPAPGLGSPRCPGKAEPRVPLLLPPPQRGPASPPALSFRRRLSRLLTQRGTPVTPGGATGRSPSRRGCPGAAQLCFPCPSPRRVISSSPSHGSPPIPPRRVFPTETLILHPCGGFPLPFPMGNSLPAFPAPVVCSRRFYSSYRKTPAGCGVTGGDAHHLLPSVSSRPGGSPALTSLPSELGALWVGSDPPSQR